MLIRACMFNWSNTVYGKNVLLDYSAGMLLQLLFGTTLNMAK